MLLLGVLYAQVVVHFGVEETNLLEYLEDDFGHIIITLHDVEGFMLLLFAVFSLHSLDLQHVECDLAHLDGAQFCGVWIGGLSNKTIVIPCVIVLTLRDLFLMLIELIVQIIEINALDINLIHILGDWISRCYTNIAKIE